MLKKDELITIYHPITSKPYVYNQPYTELQPCAALAPYIRCFWGTNVTKIATVTKVGPMTKNDKKADKTITVIPDTCMDIIFHFDIENKVTDSGFCVIDEKPYSVNYAENASFSSTFAIRFYGWAAILFAGDRFAGCRNRAFDVDVFFPNLKKVMLPLIAGVDSLEERAEIASRYLLGMLDLNRINHNFMNAVCDIIDARGTLKVAEISAKNAISKRQLERIFDENMGISPKNFSALVRYQMLWHDFCYEKGVDILDLVDKYSYYDQAHLLNDFRKYHGMSPKQAVEWAVE